MKGKGGEGGWREEGLGSGLAPSNYEDGRWRSSLKILSRYAREKKKGASPIRKVTVKGWKKGTRSYHQSGGRIWGNLYVGIESWYQRREDLGNVPQSLGQTSSTKLENRKAGVKASIGRDAD